MLQRRLGTREFRLYTNRDVIGVEVGGALKNVMAIATGIADGLGLGENARAALITRGLAEMTRLAVALGAVSGDARRARRARRPRAHLHGQSLAQSRSSAWRSRKGETAASVERETRMIAEGARTVTSALALARALLRELADLPRGGRGALRGQAAGRGAGLAPRSGPSKREDR